MGGVERVAGGGTDMIGALRVPAVGRGGGEDTGTLALALLDLIPPCIVAAAS